MTKKPNAPQRWRAAAVTHDGPNGPAVVASRTVYDQDHAIDLAERLARAYNGPGAPALPFVAPL